MTWIPPTSMSTRSASIWRSTATQQVTGALDRLHEYFARPAGRPDEIDEFAALEAEKPEDLVALFEDRFYFGCEADDPLITWAFAEDVNPLGRACIRSSALTSGTGTCKT